MNQTGRVRHRLAAAGQQERRLIEGLGLRIHICDGLTGRGLTRSICPVTSGHAAEIHRSARSACHDRHLPGAVAQTPRCGRLRHQR